MLHSWTLQLHVIVETLCMTDDTSMDIMLAHLLIKLNTYMLRLCIIFFCVSFLLFMFSFTYAIESSE